MNSWIRETVDYIIHKGTAEVYGINQFLYGTTDMRQAKKGHLVLLTHADRFNEPFRRTRRGDYVPIQLDDGIVSKH